MPSRYSLLTQWLQQHFKRNSINLTPIQNDASFRQHYRLTIDNISYIAIDAPPQQENNEAYINIAKALKQQGLNTPEVIEGDLKQGFLLVNDFGNTLLASVLKPENADKYYQLAMSELLKFHGSEKNMQQPPPKFDEAYILKELAIFKQWFLENHLEIDLTAEELRILNNSFKLLVKNNLQQPQCCIHRDYHSRNLMLLNNHKLAILDFQDAMIGPISYDIVSLLKDCYILWPEEKVSRWALDFHQMLCDNNYLTDISTEKYLQWFDLTGLQRHLKVLGIFTRLDLRDNKPMYLAYLDLALNYVIDVAAKYPQLAPLYQVLINKITPRVFGLNL